jgi:site-specific DNA recombinase
MPRAVLYVRISSDPVGLERGIGAQEDDCRQLAERLGWRVVGVFRENDTSAFRRKVIVLPSGERVRRVVRPGFRAMLQMLSRGEAEALVTYDLDRAVRDPRDLENLIDTRVLAGFRVASVTGSLRLDTDADVAMARVMVAMANKASADTARRVKRVLSQRAAEGLWHSGRAPFGYRATDSRLVILPQQAELIRRAVAKVLAGHSIYSVVKVWNEAGIHSAEGTLWQAGTLKAILLNPALVGIREYRPIAADGSRPKEAVLSVAGQWEPILDVEVSERLRVVLGGRADGRTGLGHSTARLFPFSGLVFCSACELPMHKKGNVYACTGKVGTPCSRSINAEELTTFVEGLVLRVFSQPDIGNLIATSHPDRSELSVYRQALTEDRERLTRVDDDYYDSKIDRTAWSRQRSRLLKRIEANQRICNTFEVTVNLEGADLTKTAMVWPTMGPAWKHDAAELLIDRVTVDRHPVGMARAVKRHVGEDAETFGTRRAVFREAILRQRVTVNWAVGVRWSNTDGSPLRQALRS